MPKNKKPRKKRQPPKAKVINKYPHCQYCGNETRLASSSELANMRAHDNTFNMEFLFVPTCECWSISGNADDWMVL